MATSVPTPLERADGAVAELAPGRELWLKREDLHELGSFKWRGALPTLEAFQSAGATGVVTASTGNHGAATAWAAARVGMRATVFAPVDASAAKLALVERHGADVELAGRDLDEAKEEARRFAAERALRFFEDGAERTQYDAYGAIADEVFEQLRGEGARPGAVRGAADDAATRPRGDDDAASPTEGIPDAIVVPVGNGALLGGIGIATCRRSPETKRIGVVAAGAPVMAESWERGEPVETGDCETFADGLAVRVSIPFALDVLGEVATAIVRVSEREIARGVEAYARAGIRAEGAAGAALAALAKVEPGDRVVVVVTGRNIDDELFTRAVERPESFPD